MPEEYFATVKHLILDARFSSEPLVEATINLGFLATIAFKATTEKYLWNVLGYQLPVVRFSRHLRNNWH